MLKFHHRCWKRLCSETRCWTTQSQIIFFFEFAFFFHLKQKCSVLHGPEQPQPVPASEHHPDRISSVQRDWHQHTKVWNCEPKKTLQRSPRQRLASVKCRTLPYSMFPECYGDNIDSLQPGSASDSAPLAPPQAENGHARSDLSQTHDDKWIYSFFFSLKLWPEQQQEPYIHIFKV